MSLTGQGSGIGSVPTAVVRYYSGEERALELYRGALDGSGGPFSEIVALGFAVDFGLAWYPLTNIARDPQHTFEVDGTQVQQMLRNRDRPVVLWHAHAEQEGPSAVDIEHFPAWLVNRGAIFCCRTGRTTLYNGDGILDSTSGVSESLAR